MIEQRDIAAAAVMATRGPRCQQWDAMKPRECTLYRDFADFSRAVDAECERIVRIWKRGES